MLPRSFFERISAAYRLRTAASPRERRKTIRADIRRPTQLSLLTAGVVTGSVKTRVREMSMGGCSIMLAKRLRVGEDFLVCFNVAGDETIWLWCRTQRCTELDRLCFVVGCTFFRALFPGQKIQHGTSVRNLLWFQVDGVAEPPNPYLASA